VFFALILTADIGRVEEWVACGINVLHRTSRTSTYKLLTDVRTYSMEQSPSWEANRSEASQ